MKVLIRIFFAFFLVSGLGFVYASSPYLPPLPGQSGQSGSFYVENIRKAEQRQEILARLVSLRYLVYALLYLLSVVVIYKSIREVSVRKGISKTRASFFVLLYLLVLSSVPFFFGTFSLGVSVVVTIPVMLFIYSLPLVITVSSLRKVDEENSSALILKKIISVVFAVISILVVLALLTLFRSYIFPGYI